MTIANKLVFKNIKAALGLTECKWLYAGAAPLSRDHHDFFASIGLPIMEVYGMCASVSAIAI